MQNFYTVCHGDTLWQIASRWNIPISSLIAANNLSSLYIIFVGQQLSMPQGVDVYRVQAGDNVFSIAKRFGIHPDVIFAANELNPPYILQVNQLLKIPPGVKEYIVQPGDTLFQLARRFNVVTSGIVNYQFIRQYNRLQVDTLYIGQHIRIPYAPIGEKGYIAFFSNEDGTVELWIYHLGDGKKERLTDGLGESHSVPFWSPDGMHIAFVGRNLNLYVIHLQGKKIMMVDQFENGGDHYLHWSHDSKRLVYAKRKEIIIFDVYTHECMKLEREGATDVQFFPNGNEILFQAADVRGTSQLYRVTLDGRGYQITQNEGGRYNHVRLSPDGKDILYTTPGASISILHIMNLATGEDKEFPNGPSGRNFYPEWSPNSDFIAYSANAYQDRGIFSQVRVVERNGENDTIQAISNCYATRITWSRHSEEIAYLSGCNNRGEASEIWLLRLNHPVPIRLTDGGKLFPYNGHHFKISLFAKKISFSSFGSLFNCSLTMKILIG